MIIVQCVSCKAKKELSLDQASKIASDSVPMCDCGMPMVAVSAKVTHGSARQVSQVVHKR
jgi:hypothetical protein